MNSIPSWVGKTNGVPTADNRRPVIQSLFILSPDHETPGTARGFRLSFQPFEISNPGAARIVLERFGKSPTEAVLPCWRLLTLGGLPPDAGDPGNW